MILRRPFLGSLLTALLIAQGQCQQPLATLRLTDDGRSGLSLRLPWTGITLNWRGPSSDSSWSERTVEIPTLPFLPTLKVTFPTTPQAPSLPFQQRLPQWLSPIGSAPKQDPTWPLRPTVTLSAPGLSPTSPGEGETYVPIIPWLFSLIVPKNQFTSFPPVLNLLYNIFLPTVSLNLDFLKNSGLKIWNPFKPFHPSWDLKAMPNAVVPRFKIPTLPFFPTITVNLPTTSVANVGSPSFKLPSISPFLPTVRINLKQNPGMFCLPTGPFLPTVCFGRRPVHTSPLQYNFPYLPFLPKAQLNVPDLPTAPLKTPAIFKWLWALLFLIPFRFPTLPWWLWILPYLRQSQPVPPEVAPAVPAPSPLIPRWAWLLPLLRLFLPVPVPPTPAPLIPPWVWVLPFLRIFLPAPVPPVPASLVPPWLWLLPLLRLFLPVPVPPTPAPLIPPWVWLLPFLRLFLPTPAAPSPLLAIPKWVWIYPFLKLFQPMTPPVPAPLIPQWVWFLPLLRIFFPTPPVPGPFIPPWAWLLSFLGQLKPATTPPAPAPLPTPAPAPLIPPWVWWILPFLRRLLQPPLPVPPTPSPLIPPWVWWVYPYYLRSFLTPTAPPVPMIPNWVWPALFLRLLIPPISPPTMPPWPWMYPWLNQFSRPIIVKFPTIPIWTWILPLLARMIYKYFVRLYLTSLIYNTYVFYNFLFRVLPRLIYNFFHLIYNFLTDLFILLPTKPVVFNLRKSIGVPFFLRPFLTFFFPMLKALTLPLWSYFISKTMQFFIQPFLQYALLNFKILLFIPILTLFAPLLLSWGYLLFVIRHPFLPLPVWPVALFLWTAPLRHPFLMFPLFFPLILSFLMTHPLLKFPTLPFKLTFPIRHPITFPTILPLKLLTFPLKLLKLPVTLPFKLTFPIRHPIAFPAILPLIFTFPLRHPLLFLPFFLPIILTFPLRHPLLGFPLLLPFLMFPLLPIIFFHLTPHPLFHVLTPFHLPHLPLFALTASLPHLLTLPRLLQLFAKPLSYVLPSPLLAPLRHPVKTMKVVSPLSKLKPGPVLFATLLLPILFLASLPFLPFIIPALPFLLPVIGLTFGPIFLSWLWHTISELHPFKNLLPYLLSFLPEPLQWIAEIFPRGLSKLIPNPFKSLLKSFEFFLPLPLKWLAKLVLH